MLNSAYKKILLLTLWLFTAQLSLAAENAVPETKTTALHINLNQYDEPVLLVEFWASWCSVCKRKLPWLETLDKQNKHVKVILVNVDHHDDMSTAQIFLSQNNIQLTNIYDINKTLFKQFKTLGVPTSYIFNQQRQLVYTRNGFRKGDKRKIERAIKAVFANLQTSS